MKKFIYKICSISEWTDFKKKNLFYGTKKDLIDGYIHLSNKNQVKKTLKKHFFNKKKLMLVKIKTLKLKNLVWEKSPEGVLFPHLYSHLDITNVKSNYKIFLKKNGLHYIPKFF